MSLLRNSEDFVLSNIISQIGICKKAKLNKLVSAKSFENNGEIPIQKHAVFWKLFSKFGISVNLPCLLCSMIMIYEKNKLVYLLESFFICISIQRGITKLRNSKIKHQKIETRLKFVSRLRIETPTTGHWAYPFCRCHKIFNRTNICWICFLVSLGVREKKVEKKLAVSWFSNASVQRMEFFLRCRMRFLIHWLKECLPSLYINPRKINIFSLLRWGVNRIPDLVETVEKENRFPILFIDL